MVMKRSTADATASRGPPVAEAGPASAMSRNAAERAIAIQVVIVASCTTVRHAAQAKPSGKPAMMAPKTMHDPGARRSEPGGRRGGVAYSARRSQRADPHRPRHDLRSGPRARHRRLHAHRVRHL